MSAKLETFFELKKVVDHDCGNYQMGEIDFVNYDAISDYIKQYGDFGENQLNHVCIKILSLVQKTAIEVRKKKSQEVMESI